MKIPAEFEPIAVWMEMRKVKPFGMTEVWYRANVEVSGKVSEKTSLTDAEALEALNRLVEKGHSPCLHWCLGNKWSLELYFDGDYVTSASEPTISSAVEEALLRLIAAEGK